MKSHKPTVITLSMASVFLLVTHARDTEAFLCLIAIAPASSLTELLALNADFVTTQAIERFLPDLIDQIAYDSKRSFGSERLLTNFGAIVVKKILEADGFDLNGLHRKLQVDHSFPFNERQAGIFLGIMFGGIFKLLEQQSAEREKHVRRAKLAAEMALVLISLFQPADYLAPISSAVDIMFGWLADESVASIRKATEEFMLDAAVYPMLKCEKVKIVCHKDANGNDMYYPKDDEKHTFLTWLKASLQACGFGTSR